MGAPMNCDMENYPELAEYYGSDDYLWLADAQQFVLRSIGHRFNQLPKHRWLDSAEFTLDNHHEIIEFLAARLSPCDPMSFQLDDEGVLQYSGVEERAASILNLGERFVSSILQYLSGSNPFNNEELPSLIRKESPRFLPLVMENQMRAELQEQFLHSAKLLAAGSKYAELLSDWEIPKLSSDAQSSVRKPAGQPYGVSPEGAVALVRDWMIYLGIQSAEMTRLSGDGIDVTSSTYVAQVRNFKGFVEVQAIRESLGVAVAESKKPLIFTCGSYSSEALSFAEKAHVPLFVFDAEEGLLECVNEASRLIYEQRLIVSEDELVEAIRPKLEEVRVCILALSGALINTKRMLSVFFPSKESEIVSLKSRIEPLDVTPSKVRVDLDLDEAASNFSELSQRFEIVKSELIAISQVGAEVLALT
jgi:hypothetical protein